MEFLVILGVAYLLLPIVAIVVVMISRKRIRDLEVLLHAQRERHDQLAYEIKKTAPSDQLNTSIQQSIQRADAAALQAQTAQNRLQQQSIKIQELEAALIELRTLYSQQALPTQQEHGLGDNTFAPQATPIETLAPTKTATSDVASSEVKPSAAATSSTASPDWEHDLQLVTPIATAATPTTASANDPAASDTLDLDAALLAVPLETANSAPPPEIKPQAAEKSESDSLQVPVASSTSTALSAQAATAKVETLEKTAASSASAPQAPTAPAKAATNKAATSKTPAPAPTGPDLGDKIRQWLFGGNLVAKMGLLILFFGVAFLLKYASERVTVPIEIRLSLITLADIAFFMWGWRIRLSRPGISLPVQGASLAIMMLVTFGAMRMYHLIPPGLAFFLLFALTAFTCLLAVMQNAMWLALFGITGGFIAPIATSTGNGSHIGLFSYYLLLNAGVLAIALKRAWRPLNLVGLGFTFVISTAWGMLRYEPQHYASTQGFLIAFFVLYVAIGLLYAQRQAPKLRGVVDGTLTFGTPMMAFGLQYGLVKDMQFGLAYSALALGLFYGGLASMLWRGAQKKGQAEYRLLVEALLALGVVFATLTIPLALDGRWTSAAWALEGAGIVWLGLRQQRPLTWGFGLLVQFGAWLSFILNLSELDHAAAKAQNIWLGFLILATASFLMACNFRQGRNERKSFPALAVFLLSLATIWLVAGAWVEIFMRMKGITATNLLVASALLVFALLALIAHKLAWAAARALGVILLVITGLAMLLHVLLESGISFDPKPLFDGPFLAATMLAAGAFVSSFFLQRQSAATEGKAPSGKLWSNFMLIFACLYWFGISLFRFALDMAPYAHLVSPADTSSYIQFHASQWIYSAALVLTGFVAILLSKKLQWRSLRWMAQPAWALFAITCIILVEEMNLQNMSANSAEWLAFGILWLGSEALIVLWQRYVGSIAPLALRALHMLRLGTPWLLIWPVGHAWISRILGSSAAEQELLNAAGWFTSGSWSRYLPAWAMMALLGLILNRAAKGEQASWPVRPLQQWHLSLPLPFAIAWTLWLVIFWNLTQNGAMAPLPYLPLLNPLDLSTGFAFLLTLSYARVAPARLQASVTSNVGRTLFGCIVYLWLNLVLLRSLAQYCGIEYQFDAMFDSRLVQVVLALVWSVSALFLMRRAVTTRARSLWMFGAALLALVVFKLFMVDLSQSGSIERIVSFVGVGLLMVAIGYLAPLPTSAKNDAGTNNANNEPNAPNAPDAEATEAKEAADSSPQS